MEIVFNTRARGLVNAAIEQAAEEKKTIDCIFLNDTEMEEFINDPYFFQPRVDKHYGSETLFQITECYVRENEVLPYRLTYRGVTLARR